MNLIIDIGNSRVKVALVQGGEVVNTVALQSVEEFDVQAFCAANGDIDRAIVASTGASAEGIVEALQRCGVEVLEMNSSTKVPIGNDYATPQTLGVDRLAAAVAAVELYGDDCLIVDFGTAITIDLVEGGRFCGGNISPGMRTRFRALHDYTSRLPECDATEEILAIGRTTRQAIEQGVMQGITNEIEGYISAFLSKNAKLSIIFTGGDAKSFVKRIKNAIFAKCDLVVRGLNTILEYNAKSK